MTREHSFDKQYWTELWGPEEASPPAGSAMASNPPHPALEQLNDLAPGSALDVGCGAGAEALRLAELGWRTTGVDISAPALAHARRRAEQAGLAAELTWVEADAVRWEPAQAFDLVTTFYAHPDIPQLDFYEHIGRWVVPGGSLLIVGHLVHGHGHGHGGGGEAPPPTATAELEAVLARFSAPQWSVVSAETSRRTLTAGSRRVELDDVVVRLTRPA